MFVIFSIFTMSKKVMKIIVSGNQHHPTNAVDSTCFASTGKSQFLKVPAAHQIKGHLSRKTVKVGGLESKVLTFLPKEFVFNNSAHDPSPVYFLSQEA